MFIILLMMIVIYQIVIQAQKFTLRIPIGVLAILLPNDNWLPNNLLASTHIFKFDGRTNNG